MILLQWNSRLELEFVRILYLPELIVIRRRIDPMMQNFKLRSAILIEAE